MKKIKRFVGTIMALAVLLAVIAPTVQATGIIGDITTEEMLLPSEDALYSAYGMQVSDELKTVLIENGADVEDDSLIEIIQAASDSGNTAIYVTNLDGDEAYRDVFMALDNNGNIKHIAVPDEGEAQIQVIRNLPKDFFGDSSFVLHAKVSYNRYVNELLEFFQPIYAAFTYTKSASTTVNSVEIAYNCIGYEYYYPSFTPVNPNASHVNYRISVAPSSHTAGVEYRNTVPLISSRVISGSAPISEQLLDVAFTIVRNGSTVSVEECWPF